AGAGEDSTRQDRDREFQDGLPPFPRDFSWRGFRRAPASRRSRPTTAMGQYRHQNPAYSDILYVENLIGAETVNTLPPETLNAFKDHGKVPGETVADSLDEAAAALGRLKALGIDLEAITEKLQQDGVTAFATSFDQLIAALEKKRKTMVSVEPSRKV